MDCISDQLEVALVPRFDGKDATLSKSFFVEPGDGTVEPGDVIVRKGAAPSRRQGGGAGGPVTSLRVQ
jgi:hypothetical protein